LIARRTLASLRQMCGNVVLEVAAARHLESRDVRAKRPAVAVRQGNYRPATIDPSTSLTPVPGTNRRAVTGIPTTQRDG
jgi:hypothetical protein